MIVQIDEQAMFLTLLQQVIRDAIARRDKVMLDRAAGMMDSPEFMALPEGAQADALHHYAGADMAINFPIAG